MSDLQELYKAVETKETYNFDEIRNNLALASQVQTRLQQFELLTAPDGKWGNLSRFALARFNKLSGLTTPDLSYESLKTLIESDYQTWQTSFYLKRKDLASQLHLYFKFMDWRLDTKIGAVNLCGLRGTNRDLTLNADEPFKYNDRMIAFTYKYNSTGARIPSLIGNWLGTTQPGRYYWNNPLNSSGCACIVADEQFKAWSVGYHRNYRALVQVKPVKFVRGVNQKPGNDLIGLNIHSVGNGQDYFFNDEIGKYSAACQVFANRDQEFDGEFMPAIYSDVNYKANKNYIWDYAVITGKLFRSFFPVF